MNILDTKTPNGAPKLRLVTRDESKRRAALDALFDAPDFVSDGAACICEVARDDLAGALDATETTGNGLTSATTYRAKLDALAPFARDAVAKAGLTVIGSGDDLGEETRDCERALTPAILAHFAFVALAFLESEKARGDS